MSTFKSNCSRIFFILLETIWSSSLLWEFGVSVSVGSQGVVVERRVWFGHLKFWLCVHLQAMAFSMPWGCFNLCVKCQEWKHFPSKYQDKKKENCCLQFFIFLLETTGYLEKAYIAVSLDGLCSKTHQSLEPELLLKFIWSLHDQSKSCVHRLDSVPFHNPIDGVPGWNLKAWSWRRGCPVWKPQGPFIVQMMWFYRHLYTLTFSFSRSQGILLK